MKNCKHINIVQVGTGTHTEYHCADCNEHLKSVNYETKTFTNQKRVQISKGSPRAKTEATFTSKVRCRTGGYAKPRN